MNGAHGPGGAAGSGGTDVAVVVVNFGSTGLLEQNLTELTGAATIIVVDNWSSRQERAAVSAACARHGWSLVTSATNAGFGGGCNLGAAQAISLGADVLVFVNPDAHLAATGLARLADVARAQPDALVAPVIETPDGRPWSPGLMVVDLHDGATLSLRRFRLAGRRDPAGEHGHETWLSGACLAITVDLWVKVGGFDEDYFLYWEDVDLSHRILAAGGSLVVVPEVTVVHDEGSTHGNHHSATHAKSGTYYYYSTRNRLLFAVKHLADDDVRRWRRSSLGAARSIVLRGGRRQLLRSSTPWVSPLRGTMAGLRVSRRP